MPPVTEPAPETDDNPGRPDGERTIYRSGVMKRLVSLYEQPRYLEVGVSAGRTFFKVPAAHKVAVDPAFRFDVEQARAEHPEAEFHQVPSDEYFARIIDPDARFDVIYLDGLHVHEQTLRDLMNALHHLQPQGVIVVDDTRPPTHLASLPDREEFAAVRRYLHTADARWMGDIYKLVWFVETFMPHLSYRTIAENHGQTVIWRARRTDYPQRTLREVADLPFERMVVDEDALQVTPFPAIRRRLRADLGL